MNLLHILNILWQKQNLLFADIRLYTYMLVKLFISDTSFERLQQTHRIRVEENISLHTLIISLARKLRNHNGVFSWLSF